MTKATKWLCAQPSLIRVIAVRLMGSSGPKLSSCGQRRLWSDWADAQADLSLIHPGWSESSLGALSWLNSIFFIQCIFKKKFLLLTMCFEKPFYYFSCHFPRHFLFCEYRLNSQITLFKFQTFEPTAFEYRCPKWLYFNKREINVHNFAGNLLPNMTYCVFYLL